MMSENLIEAYTDGSCNTKLKVGAWAAIIFVDDKEIVLTNTAINTTNQRMELAAVLNVLDYLKNNKHDNSRIVIYTDSQYVAGVEGRIEKFKLQDYKTKKGEPIRNDDLVRELVYFIENMNIDFIKVKAHQKETETKNYNRVVDKLCRKLVREYVSKNCKE
ncbi:MAG: ribonuclease H [Bacteroidota bacterium]